MAIAFICVGAVAGLIFVAVGLFDWVQTRKLLRRAQPAQGIWVDIALGTESDGAQAIYRVVAFDTAAGQVIHFRGRTGAPYRTGALGDRVEVLYDPADPQHARIKSFTELWLASILFTLIGIGLLIAAPILLM